MLPQEQTDLMLERDSEQGDSENDYYKMQEDMFDDNKEGDDDRYE